MTEWESVSLAAVFVISSDALARTEHGWSHTFWIVTFWIWLVFFALRVLLALWDSFEKRSTK